MRIGIAGITGRVGRLLVDAVRHAGAELSGGTSRHLQPGSVIPIFDHLGKLAAGSDLIIDFSHPGVTAGHADILASAGIGWVLGTTGLSAETQAAVEAASRRIAIVQAANFSPGVTLVLDLAARLASVLPPEEYDAEILEMHHRQKIDAPSGTALAIGEAVTRGRNDGRQAVHESGRDGHTGARQAGAIGFASLRGGQIVGEHTLSFTSGGEQIALSHRAFDRGSFAAGAVRAALWARHQAPGLYTMRDVLGLVRASPESAVPSIP